MSRENVLAVVSDLMSTGGNKGSTSFACQEGGRSESTRR
jgi:hypothetical protein